MYNNIVGGAAHQAGSMDGVLSLGPWGGDSDDPWSFRASREITDIIIRQDDSTVSISFKDGSGHITGKFEGRNFNSTGEEEKKIPIVSPSAEENLMNTSKKVFIEGGVISLGPWGGKSGHFWSYKAIHEITEIIIRHDAMSIVSLFFRDANGHITGKFGDNNRTTASTTTRGSSGSVEEKKVQLRWPSEYLKSISGTYGNSNFNGGDTLIQSLSFTTNLTTYGPFGNSNGGDSFSIPITDSVVVGFFGRADTHLHALGIFLQPAPPKRSLSLGPWGGQGGDAFSFTVGSWITEITIHSDSNIKSISFKDANGHLYGKFGGKSPNDHGKEQTVKLDGQFEYLKSIKGTYGNYCNHMVVTSLSFVTNMSTHGPFGKTTGTSFSLPIEGSIVNGFHGRAGYYLDAIGIFCHAKPRDVRGAISIGPWGGSGGDPWSYITNHGINEIVIHSDLNIKSISFLDTSGHASATFGGKNAHDTGYYTNTVPIHWPNEHLISISGTYGKFAGMTTITSLTFTTNLTSCGPFGTESGTSFSIPITNSTIVGFHGRAGHYLDAIGVFVKPAQTTI